MKKIILSFLLVCSLLFLMCACDDIPELTDLPGNEAGDEVPDDDTPTDSNKPAEDDENDAEGDDTTGEAPEEDLMYIAVQGYGVIVVQLYAEQAPITVANFKKLASEGFYDGLTFHRIIESFVIQGGCPKGDGTGGAEENIKGEFAMNSVDTGLKHVEGTISMARAGHPYEAYHNAGYMDIPYEQREPYYNSASSQFFIVTETGANNTASLDGKYAAFGQVVDGMDIVKAIAAVETDTSDKPLTPVVIQTVTADKDKADAALRVTDQ